jgi:hypothetical protein
MVQNVQRQIHWSGLRTVTADDWTYCRIYIIFVPGEKNLMQLLSNFRTRKYSGLATHTNHDQQTTQSQKKQTAITAPPHGRFIRWTCERTGGRPNMGKPLEWWRGECVLVICWGREMTPHLGQSQLSEIFPHTFPQKNRKLKCCSLWWHRLQKKLTELYLLWWWSCIYDTGILMYTCLQLKHSSPLSDDDELRNCCWYCVIRATTKNNGNHLFFISTIVSVAWK